MNDTELRQMLQLAERRVDVPPGLTDRVFTAMIEELEIEATPQVSPITRRHRDRQWWAVAWRPAVAIAAAVALIVLATTVVSVRDAPSALAALQDARDRFEEVPSYHARTTVRANDDAQDPDFETVWETEDWYQDGAHWRTTFTSSTSTSTNAVGDYTVMSPALFGTYDASTNVFTARPSGEIDSRSADPSFFFDPSLQWWSDGTVGGIGKPSDEFFDENCTASSGQRLAGRPATKLTCAAEPADLELWLDDQTGMILRLAAFDVVREITSIELDPRFPAGVFDVVAPEGAKKRWGGEGEPPPEYAVAIGSDVAARFQIVEGRTAGIEIVAATETDLWTLVHRCDRGCTTSLLRIDARSGAVTATIAPPDGLSFTGATVDAEGGVWTSLTRWDDSQPTSPAFVQRLDPATSTLQGPLVETGTSSGGLRWIDGAVWTTSGRDREVKIGPAESRYHAVARFDPRSSAVTQFDVGADAIGTPFAVGRSLWVPTTKIDPRDPREQVYELVALDPVSGEVQSRVPVEGWPSSPVTDGERVYALVADSDRTSVVVIDAGSRSIVSTMQVGADGSDLGGMAFAGGSLWIANIAEGTVVKVDPSRLEVTGSISTGLDPSDAESAAGSVWVVNSGDGTLVRIDIE